VAQILARIILEDARPSGRPHEQSGLRRGPGWLSASGYL